MQVSSSNRYGFDQSSRGTDTCKLQMDQSAPLDDKSPDCIPFILERLKVHDERYTNKDNVPPFFLGLNGVQGAGKTMLVGIQ